MPTSSSLPAPSEVEPPLPRPTVVGGSRPSSRASSIAQSAYSSGQTSRSASPAQRSGRLSPRNRSAGTPSGSSLRSARSASRPLGQGTAQTIAHPSNVVEISSDSSDEDDIVAIGPDPSQRRRSSDFEVSSIRRAPPAAPLLRSDLFSPPPPMGRPAEPLFFDDSPGARMVGVSADPDTGDFLTRPMPIVRPQSSTSYSDPDGSFSIVSAQTAPRPLPLPRSDHPITDQRLRSTNLAMPTRSPPRSKPPPIEHPLLSKYTCPICFDAPTNLCVTPCGHFFCGECLFQALKTQAVQRGAMEDDDQLFSFNLFSSFAPAGTFGAGRGANTGLGGSGQDLRAGGGGGGRGGTAAGAGRGRGGARGGAAGGGRGRNKPDPLAGQCPVCRAKIKGAFNGREKNGVTGLRLTMGKPIDDPREESGKMKTDPKAKDGGSVKGSDDEEAVLPISKKLEQELGEGASATLVDQWFRVARNRRRSSASHSGGSTRGSPGGHRGEATGQKRQRQASDSSATQTE